MKLFAFALPDKALKPLALDQIRRSKTNNDALYADLDQIACDGPAFAADGNLAALRAKALEMGAELRHETPEALFFVWRSPMIGFPNGLYLFESEGKISIYGRALYGRRDFGANRAFIKELSSIL